MKFKIADVCVNVDSWNEKILDNINEEYELLDKLDDDSNEDIKIGFEGNRKGKFYVFKASMRKFIIRFHSFNNLKLDIPYNQNNDFFFRIINPYYETRHNLCLTDFFHNIFLGILQIELLKKNSTLFHASAAILNENKANIFFGKAQSGKSEIIDLITREYNGSILSEDFCVIDCNSRVFALPHKSRVSILSYDSKRNNVSIIEKVNRFVVNKVLKRNCVRRMPFKRIYDRHSFSKSGEIGKVYIIKRDSDSLYSEKCTRSEFVGLCMEVMEEEFGNFVGFKDVLCIYRENLSWEEMLSRTKCMLGRIYDSNECEILNIPFYPTLEELEDNVKSFFA